MERSKLHQQHILTKLNEIESNISTLRQCVNAEVGIGESAKWVTILNYTSYLEMAARDAARTAVAGNVYFETEGVA